MENDSEQESTAEAWSRDRWAPVLVWAIHAFSVLLFNPLGGMINPRWGMFALGAIFSQPLLCAAWAALAPHALLWRVPVAAAGCALLSLVVISRGPEPEIMALAAMGGLFVVFGVGLAVVRWWTGWQLAVGVDGLVALPAVANRFSVRYLLGATVVIAGLLTLGKLILGQSGGSDADDAAIVVGRVLATTAVFGLALIPVVGVAMVALGRSRRLLAPILACLIGGVLSSGLAVMVLKWVEPSAPSFAELWRDFGAYSAGGMGSMMLSALALRWAGYRLVGERRHA